MSFKIMKMKETTTMKIKIDQYSKTEKIELDRSREFWEDEKNASQDMTGYREEDI